MAIRIDASGDYLRRTTGLPSPSNFTMAVWFYYAAERSAYAFFAGLEDAVAFSNYYALIGFTDTNTFSVNTHDPTDRNFNFALNPAVGAWHFVAFLCNGSAVRGLHRNPSGVWQTGNVSGVPSFTSGVLYVGNDSYDEWTNIRLFNLKVWDAGLSDEDVKREADSFYPVYRPNLYLHAPLARQDDLRDISGNGRHLTAGGTLTTEPSAPFVGVKEQSQKIFWWLGQLTGGSTHAAQSALMGLGATLTVPQATAQALVQQQGQGTIFNTAQLTAQELTTLFGLGSAPNAPQLAVQALEQLNGLGNAANISQMTAQELAHMRGAGRADSIAQTTTQAQTRGDGLGSLLEFPQAAVQAASELRGNGSATSNAQKIGQALAALQGAGANIAIAAVTSQGLVRLDGVGQILSTLVEAGFVLGVAWLGGNGTLVMLPQGIAQPQAEMRGAGSAASNVQVTAQGLGRLDGSGSESAQGQLTAQEIAQLVGFGSLPTLSQMQANVFAALAGNAQFAAAPERTIQAVLRLDGVGTQAALAQAIAQGVVRADGIATFLAPASLTANARGRLDGLGTLTGALPILVLDELSGELLLVVLTQTKGIRVLTTPKRLSAS